MTPQELILKKLYPAFKAELDLEQRGDGICEISDEVVKDGYVVTSSYKHEGVNLFSIEPSWIRIFTIRSLKLVGLSQGTWENPKIFQNLIDYKGAYFILPVSDDPCELWVGGSYFDKVSPSAPFIKRKLAGAEALVRLLEDTRPALVLNNTLRKELWLNNMIIGDENHLCLATDTGALVVPRQHWKEFKQSFISLDKKVRSEALVILRSLNDGRLSNYSDRVQKFFSDNMEFAVVASKLLPQEPQARKLWLSALGGV